MWDEPDAVLVVTGSELADLLAADQFDPDEPVIVIRAGGAVMVPQRLAGLVRVLDQQERRAVRRALAEATSAAEDFRRRRVEAGAVDVIPRRPPGIGRESRPRRDRPQR